MIKTVTKINELTCTTPPELRGNEAREEPPDHDEEHPQLREVGVPCVRQALGQAAPHDAHSCAQQQCTRCLQHPKLSLRLHILFNLLRKLCALRCLLRFSAKFLQLIKT